MATEVQKGRATLQGIANDGTAIDIEYDAFIETAKVQHDWKQEEIEDETGFDACITARNQKKDADVVLVPNGATRAAAQAAAVFLDPLQTVTFTHFAVTALNGDWQYQGGSIDLSHQTGKVSLKFRKWDDATQNTLLQTDVS